MTDPAACECQCFTLSFVSVDLGDSFWSPAKCSSFSNLQETLILAARSPPPTDQLVRRSRANRANISKHVHFTSSMKIFVGEHPSYKKFREEQLLCEVHIFRRTTPKELNFCSMKIVASIVRENGYLICQV